MFPVPFTQSPFQPFSSLAIARPRQPGHERQSSVNLDPFFSVTEYPLRYYIGFRSSARPFIGTERHHLLALPHSESAMQHFLARREGNFPPASRSQAPAPLAPPSPIKQSFDPLCSAQSTSLSISLPFFFCSLAAPFVISLAAQT